MRLSPVLITGTLLLLAPLVGAAADPGYRAYFLTQLDASRARFLARPDAYLEPVHLHIAACAAGAEMRAFQLTGRREYAEASLARMRAITTVLAREEASFFVPYPFTWTYRALDAAGLIDAPLKAQVRAAVAHGFRARDLTALHNQTLQRAAGLALAATTWPDLPEAAAWRDYSLAIQKMLAASGDVSENSTNYNAIDLPFVFLLADTTGRADYIQTPAMRAFFARFRDQIAPSGMMPVYGDAGNPPQPFRVAWPMENTWAMYTAAFERAARTYSDPTLRWAALLLAETGMKREPLDRAYPAIIDLFYFSFAVDWARHDLAPAAPGARPSILTRADATGPAQRDKLVLAPGRSGGAPFAMVDLYARGPHAHENQHGAVVHYEFKDTPLITALGYNNRGPDQASLVMLRPATDAFPALPGSYPANEWREVMLPTSRLPVVDASRPNVRRIDGLNVRIESSGVTARVADFRLLGESERVLDRGDKAEGWQPAPRVTDDAPQGLAHSLEWTVARGIRFHSRAVAAEFDCRQFPVLAFRWKLSSNRQLARPIILRVMSGSVNTDYHAEAAQLEPTLKRADTGARGGDRYAALEYAGWFTPGTRLLRQMVLLESGALIVFDRLTPGPMAKGLAGGPIWQMTSTDAPRRAGSWFLSSGGPLDLLVAFAPAAGRDFGVQASDIWSKRGQQTVYTRQVLTPGHSEYFVSALVPLAAGTVPETAATQAQVALEGTAAVVRLTTAGGPVVVRIEEAGAWSVTHAR